MSIVKAAVLIIKGSMTEANICTDHCLNLSLQGPDVLLLSNLFIDSVLM